MTRAASARTNPLPSCFSNKVFQIEANFTFAPPFFNNAISQDDVPDSTYHADGKRPD